MRGIVILAVLIALTGAVSWWAVMRQSMSDQGVWLLVATGNPHGDTTNMDVSVELPTVMQEPVKTDEHDNPLWELWVSEHYQMRDEAGNDVPGARQAHSLLVNEEKTINLPEFYIHFNLKQGQKYTLEFIPHLAKKTHYRHEFVLSDEKQHVERMQFEAFKPKG